MFRTETNDAARLKRIVIGGTGALLAGFTLLAINLIGPLLGGAGYGTDNLVFSLIGIVVVVLAAHPTYRAAERLDDQ